MSRSPAVSVAMSVWNGERFLDAAVESILGQTFDDFEFLIIDDGSTDRSREILAAYAEQDKRLRVITRENRGLVASLNQLIEEAGAALIARMDADDISHPERLARQVAFLEANPDHGVVGTCCDDIDESGAPAPGSWPSHPLTHEAFLENIATGGPLLAHPSVMFRRDVVAGVGGYHSAFRHCEDFDLWLRLADRTRIANLPDRLLRYRHYQGQVSSRHAFEQQIGVAVSRIAHRERNAGRPDPTESLASLPPLDQLDALFGQDGIEHEVRAQVARALLHSPSAMRGQGFDLLLQHVAEGGKGSDLWRTVLRLVRLGEPVRAMKLATALATTTAVD